jgi:hypothetical protein
MGAPTVRQRGGARTFSATLVMEGMRLRYWPNPAHKRETTEEGPPRWRPHKTPCPHMTIEERDALLAESVPESPHQPGARRYALRRSGDLEWFVGVPTEYQQGEVVFHGYPTQAVPAKVLRVFRDSGKITEAEYRKMVKDLG